MVDSLRVLPLIVNSDELLLAILNVLSICFVYDIEERIVSKYYLHRRSTARSMYCRAYAECYRREDARPGVLGV